MKKGNYNKFPQLQKAAAQWKKNPNASLNYIAAQYEISVCALSNYISKNIFPGNKLGNA